MEKLSNLYNIKLRRLSGDKISEEDVRQAFNSDIKLILQNEHGINLTFKNEVLTSNKEFIDSKWGNFVIEYKKPSVKLGDREREQLKKYLRDLGKYSWGILTNGIEVEVYNYSKDFDDYVIDDTISGEVNQDQVLYLCNVISNKEKIILTKNNINDLLGIERNKEIIKKLYRYLMTSKNKRTKLLYNEWQKLFNISETNDSLNEEKKGPILKFYAQLFDEKIISLEQEYKALFAIQTYYSIILKLVLYKIINDKSRGYKFKYNFKKYLFEDIESNKLFRENNIINLIDGDFFSWYLHELEEEDYKNLYSITSEIVFIETEKINTIFIKFYENIFPFWVRHSMGEYYTPFYLADDIVDKTIKMSSKKDGIKLLDPTCGSGVFIISALKKNITNVYGIDINPLAVLTAKMNYLINNFDLSEPLEIPIYLGDSTYFPEKISLNGVECFQYELTTSVSDRLTLPFVFSQDIVFENNFFQILDEIELHIRNKNFDGAINVIISYDKFYYSELKKHYDELIIRLIDLENKNLNSIWLKIIGNYLKSGSIRDVDIVVGNPPWVRWSNLPDNYKLLIKKNCRIDGIFSSDNNSGGVDLNISALITYMTVRERLSKSGCLGFIMPDSLLFNKSFEGFRNMELPNGEKYYLNKVVRWNDKNEKPFNPVSLDFAEFYFSFHKQKLIEVYERKNKKERFAVMHPTSFNNHYIITDKNDYPEIKKVLGSNNIEFRSGISLVKGGHYLLKFKDKYDEYNSEFYYFELQGRRLKNSNKTVIIENEIVFPYIKTEDINGKIIEEANYYCIFPYPYGSKKPYSLKVLRENYPNFYKYFMSEKIQNSINSSSDYNKRIQNNDFDVGIFRVGEYTYSNFFLITRDNTKSEFSIVGKLYTDWGEKKMPIFDGHINFVSRINNQELTLDIAKDLLKKFSREGVKLYIKNSSDSRSISSRLYNDINLL